MCHRGLMLLLEGPRTIREGPEGPRTLCECPAQLVATCLDLSGLVATCLDLSQLVATSCGLKGRTSGPYIQRPSGLMPPGCIRQACRLFTSARRDGGTASRSGTLDR